MKHISIRELHMQTGRWVRAVARADRIVITDRGVPIAVVAPYTEGESARRFADRRETERFRELPALEGDSTGDISEDRERP